MGTLTAGQPRLSHYCEHKLPTSCRLSSIGDCCACYDNRAHSITYSTYIDGVGFVARGTRWQRYCWFCKEFWENRVNAAGLPATQTRIPHEPDQTAFLERWYEFHRGHRTIKHDDGTEEQIAVLGEDFHDVAPGCLPRTLDELRAGRLRSELEDREREEGIRRQATSQQLSADAGPSLEDALDSMFQAAEEEERSTEHHPGLSPFRPSDTAQSGSTDHTAHAMSITGARSRDDAYQARRVAALGAALQRMRHGIERVILQLRDLGQHMPDHSEASSRLLELSRTVEGTSGLPTHEQAQGVIDSVNELTENVLATQNNTTLTSMRARVDEARQQVDESRQHREQVAADLDLADQEFRASQARLRQLQTEQRTAENYQRLFGTREEMIAQGDDWESPIGGMFDRATERARAAEEVRREERMLRRVLEDEEHGGEQAARRLAELESLERDVWGVPRTRRPDSHQSAADSTNNERMPNNHDRTSDGAGTSAPTQGRFGSTRTDSDLRGDEVGLQEYYTLLRRQNWSQEENARVAPGTELVTNASPSSIRIMIGAPTNIVAGSPGQWLDEDPSSNNDRGLDAVFVLTKLSSSAELRELLPWANFDTVTRLLRSAESNNLSWADRENIESMMQMSEIIWGTRLPAERNRRRRSRGEVVTFTPDAQDMASQGIIIIHDIEIMAECFQMSRRVREQCGLTAPEQLVMLYRLQRGERRAEDRTLLSQMLQRDDALSCARTIHEQHYSELSTEPSSRRVRLESERRAAARRGDHSRVELNALRRATRDVALAAGRAAMALGPRELLERMASRDEETRAAYQQMQDNGFIPEESMTTRRLRTSIRYGSGVNDLAAVVSPTASESADSDEEAQGLDAKDSGRPTDPLTEEEMTVLLDCRICYTQKASIVTVPCGHLAMCEWCSEQHSPTMVHDRTKPRRAAGCPVCRKQVRQKFKVIRG